MATPLFVVDEATLKQKTRLTALIADSDADLIFDEAVLGARIRFYRSLGKARVDAILTTSHTDVPTTDAQVIRALASSTEVKMVWCALLQRLPNAFLDTAGDVFARRNVEAPLKEKGPSDLAREISRCENEIGAALASLADPTVDGCDDVHIWDGTRHDEDGVEAEAPAVGLTLRPWRRNPKPNIFND